MHHSSIDVPFCTPHIERKVGDPGFSKAVFHSVPNTCQMCATEGGGGDMTSTSKQAWHDRQIYSNSVHVCFNFK